MYNFRLVSVERPVDPEKNRWNFNFSYGIGTKDDLNEDTNTIKLNRSSRLVSIRTFQEGGQPLYGMIFTWEDGSTEMLGQNDKEQEGNIVEIAENQRVVGISNRSDKTWYRYFLRFEIATL